jgi:hypothetical protein
MQVTVQGLPNVETQMKRIARGLVAAQQTVVYVGSRLPYGYGEEYGHHRRSGKLARKSGGALFLNRAFNEVVRDGERDLGEGLTRVTAPGPWMLVRLARWVRRLARSYAPVGTQPIRTALRKRRGGVTIEQKIRPGRLRKSIHIERGRR